jgi:hypothetical protein
MNVRNNKLALAGGASALMAILTGCGAITSLIPDQNIRDPLKLNNVGIRAVVGASRVLAVAEKLSGPYANIGSVPISPSNFRIDQPIRTTCRVSVPSGELPPTLTLRDLTLTLTVLDTDGRSVELDPATLAGPIECTRIPDTAADYEMGIGPYVLSEDLGGKRDAVLDILRSGGENNVKGILTVDVDSNPTLQNGSTITFWFEEGTGVASF